MLVGDPSSESKAQAGSALFLMLRPLSAKEAVEDAGQILFGDSNASIPYGHDYAILAHFALETDPPPGRRVATSIVDEYPEHAFNKVDVCQNPEWLLLAFKLKVE